MKSENEELRAQLFQQTEKILQLEKEISRIKSPAPSNKKSTDSCTKEVGKMASSEKKKNSASPRALPIPTSCDGLRKSGHFPDGVYLVLNEGTSKMDAVFCQFLGAKQSM